MLIRVANIDDEPAMDAVIAEAFGADGEVVVGLLHSLRADGLLIDSMTYVAEEDAGVVGVVASSTMTLEAPTGPLPLLNLTPLGVRSAAQGQGVGRALVERVIAAADERPEPMLFVEGWADPKSVYDRYFNRLPEAMTAPPEAFEAEACQIRYLAGFQPDVHRGTLVYPEAIRMLDHESSGDSLR
jgi:predicted N-acetyltransferase YhbS